MRIYTEMPRGEHGSFFIPALLLLGKVRKRLTMSMDAIKLTFEKFMQSSKS